MYKRQPLFLAEKNVYYPSPKEVAALETYVADCLFKYIQDPETYAVRASLYWKQRYPSSPWSHWTEERSKESYRAYNYAHVANLSLIHIFAIRLSCPDLRAPIQSRLQRFSRPLES